MYYVRCNLRVVPIFFLWVGGLEGGAHLLCSRAARRSTYLLHTWQTTLVTGISLEIIYLLGPRLFLSSSLDLSFPGHNDHWSLQVLAIH